MQFTLDISEARSQLNKLDDRLRTDQVVYITRHNKPAFAAVDLGYLAAVIETIEIMSDPDSYAAYRASLADIRDGRLHDHDDVEKELG